MKRIAFLTVALLGLWVSPLSGFAQDTASAAAIAERQESEERYKRLNSQVEDLLASNAALQRKISELAGQIRSLNDDLGKTQAGHGQFATREDLRKLTEAIQEIDRKREADRKLILSQMEALAKLPPPPASSSSSRRPSSEPKTPKPDTSSNDSVPSNIPDKGFVHVFEKGQYLSSVIGAYNEELKKNGVTKRISLDMVLKANPGLDPNRIPVGKKIFLPDPTAVKE